ncbi:serine hydrolase [Paenibacillus sp. BC26]|uniref:serine hydrolase domain-containing protein n=1 Tax=Paenibacillus sp. BC26 TaxID=1881032 RepID=UPI0008EA01EB|nr:serine hydrolase domain-containing protein [Paenibacillus sp. BC26]SFS56055.1 CubicO group peptidase, beta-lactamase class C family [Paenibacillus sp. BC26]
MLISHSQMLRPDYELLPDEDARVLYLEGLLQSGVTSCYAAAFYEVAGRIGEAYGGRIVTSNCSSMLPDRSRPFNVGSVTKVITAALMLKLAEQGELSLDDSVSRFVPAYRHATTLRQLMTHTSGLQWKNPWKWPRPEELAACRASIYECDLAEQPDRNAVYFSQGYFILMDVIEQVTGQSLESFAKETLFTPLGMILTTFHVLDWEPGNYSLPYDLDNRGPAIELEGLAVTGESGLYSTPGDLVHFAAMLLNGGMFDGKRIFSEAAVHAMLSEVTGGRFSKTPVFWMKSSLDLYGCFGDFVSPRAVGHPGFSGCMLMLDPQSRRAGCLVTNSQKLHADWSYYRRLWNIAACLPAEGGS